MQGMQGNVNTNLSGNCNTDQHQMQMNPTKLNKSKSNQKLCHRHNQYNHNMDNVSNANLSTVRSSTQIKRSKSAHAQIQKGQSKIDMSNGNM